MDAYQNLISGDKSPREGQTVVSGGCHPNKVIIRNIGQQIKMLRKFRCKGLAG